MCDINMGQIKRVIECCVVDENDEYMYCGTTTGDLLKINLHTKLFRQAGPPKVYKKYKIFLKKKIIIIIINIFYIYKLYTYYSKNSYIINKYFWFIT